MRIGKDILPPIDKGTSKTIKKGNRSNIVKSNGFSVDRSIPLNPKLKDLSSALILMQTAQGILQQALSVTNKLQNIASQALKSGNADYFEIQQTLSGISESINNYGGTLSHPPVLSEYFDKHSSIEMPDNEINQLNSFISNNKFTPDQLKTIVNSLNNKKNVVDRGFEFLTNKLNRDTSTKINMKSFDFPAFKNSFLKESPIDALYVQGNLNTETVSHLLR